MEHTGEISDVSRGGAAGLDAVTVSIVEELLVAVVREMRVTFSRSAFSSVISEGHDFSCVLLSDTGDLVAMSEDHPGHTFPLAVAAKEILRRYDGDIHSGDVFLVNDPYICGTHLNDVALFCPRLNCGRLRLFPAIRAHWADVGGSRAGSLTGNATNIFMEGLVIPPIRLVANGKMNQDCLDLILANMRGREDRYGDLMATFGACAVAQKRLDELEAKYGADQLDAIVETILDRTEGRVRRAIDQLPKGQFRFENYTDNDGVEREPQRVSLCLTVADGAIHCDFTGTSPQAQGPLNGGLAMVTTACFMVLKSYLDPKAPVNAGCFRPVTIEVPKGTFLNAEYPAAMGGASDLRRTVESCVLGALSQLIPERVCGDTKGGANHCYVSGPRDRSNGIFIYYEYPAGGVGGVDGLDGEHAMRTYTEGDFNTVLPVESLENLYPMTVLSSGLREGSCGAGQWRGGLGMERRVRLRADHSELTVLTDRVVVPPFGVNGGQSGMGNRFTVLRDDVEIEPSSVPGKVAAFPLKRNDVIWLRAAGGGGYGDPLDRTPELVLEDVAQGYLSPDQAERTYGVVIVGRDIDVSLTRKVRSHLRAQRCYATIRTAESDWFAGHRRVCPISSTLAARAGIADGQLVELVPSNGAPLRAWVQVSSASLGSILPIGPIGAAILRVQDGDQICLRPVVTPYTHPPLRTGADERTCVMLDRVAVT
jgi:N-methylhydantoinase B